MKLISLKTLLVCLAVTVESQNKQEENFSFPLQFQTPTSVSFTSDNSVYLPLESQSPLPYLQIQALNNMNKLPYQFLPATVTKAPSFYPTSFPHLLLSSTLKPDFEDEDEDNEQNEAQSINRRYMNLNPPLSFNNVNRTSGTRQNFEKIESKPNSRMSSFPNPYEKYEVRSPHIMSSSKVLNQNSINPAARRMIVTSEIKRADSEIDQIKSSSIQKLQHALPPGNFISSTSETAIPILRLSNEMDLDGSFSYEALGADQTHYVQHSRMENMGTDKEEQVVEGSYSYVGDDGRTYTVHYVADSNGYRASGDHLPVPPPVPEIIQRSIQFNLAEEAKKPPHLKSSWENNENEFQVSEESRHNTFHIPPPRSLFTGRTPEAFSFGFSQGSRVPNPVTAASLLSSPKTNFEIIPDQSKSKNIIQTPISPQITFLASQGAHNPSIQSQTSATKAVSIEKSPLPQLINYEADIKEPEQEASKALWRWQYGLNANPNQINNKHSISRSSGEGDDIIINFSDMTPNQYKQMMQSQILSNNNVESNIIERNNEMQYSSPNYSLNIDPHIDSKMTDNKVNNIGTEKYQLFSTTERNYNLSKDIGNYKKENQDIYTKLITSQNFIPQSQIATNSYNVKDLPYEPTQINVLNENVDQNFSTMYRTEHLYNDDKQYISSSATPLEEATSANPIMDFLNNGNQFDSNFGGKNTFKPMLMFKEEDLPRFKTTTTEETPLEEMIKENMFLKNIFKTHNKENTNKNIPSQSHDQSNNIIPEPKIENVSKYIPFQQHPTNEIKYLNSKPLDMRDVLNYVAMKNHFESIKMKPKSKPLNNLSQNSNLKDTSVYYMPVKDNNDDSENKRQENDYRALNKQQQEEREMHGLIKNYKVLQRHKNTGQKNQIASEPQRHIKAFHTQGLPPLGRAGPSMKSYLPPTYV